MEDFYKGSRKDSDDLSIRSTRSQISFTAATLNYEKGKHYQHHDKHGKYDKHEKEKQVVLDSYYLEESDYDSIDNDETSLLRAGTADDKVCLNYGCLTLSIVHYYCSY
jgi:hypothetical protein